MAKLVKNKYSAEADDPFQLGGGGSDFGSSDMGMGGGFDSGFGSSLGGGFGGSTSQVNPSNGLKPQDSVMVRGMARLKKLLGVSFPKDVPDLKKVDRINLFSYTPNELKYQPGFAQGTEYGAYNDSSNHNNTLYDYLNRTVQHAAGWEREAKTTQILSPEIKKAREIMVASIMSPVDMQTANVNVIVDDTGLTSEVEEKLTKLLSEFFNKELKLGRKMSKWVGNALYEAGASPVLILPQSNIYTMNKAVDIDYMKAGINPQELIKGIRPTTRGEGNVSSGESLRVDTNASFEALDLGNVGTERYDSFLDNLTTECMYSVEKLDFISDKHKDAIIKDRDKFKEGLKDVLDNGKNWIKFSADPSIISKRQGDIESKVDRMQKEIDKHILYRNAEPTYILNTDGAEENTDVETAAMIELPYQSVIPIIVPGAPNQHIGYFIVVNQWGEPINADSRDLNYMNDTSRTMEANMQATFGTPSALQFMDDMTGTQRFKTTSTIFGIMLRNFMHEKLEEYGLGGTQVEQHDAITTCIFRNLIDKKKVGLIFVPEPMLTYFRYDVHDDGTGKSLIEDARPITGLRTTLVTAGVMAATENSVDQKIIELNVDEKNANVQQMLEQVKNAFVEKRMMRYDNNPMNVQRELVQKSLTLVPKGIRGLQDGLSINTEHKSQGSVMPDDSLLRQLNDWVIMLTKVPGSAINKTGEEDFARSVVTTNMHFNNNVKIYQQDTNDFGTKLVRTYAKYSTVLKKKILDVLKASETDYEEYSGEAQELSKDQKEKAEKKADKLRKTDTHEHKSDTKVQTNKRTPQQNLIDVIDHITVKLPEPRIVVDKAQYEEITGFAECIDRVAQIIYNEELLPDDMNEYAGMLKVLRARIKEKLVRDFIKNVGFQSVFELPNMQDMDIDDSEELAMLLINYRKGLVNIKEQIADKLNMTGREQGPYGSDMGGGSGLGGGFGGDNSFGGGSDMTGGGVDMNMGMGNDTQGSVNETGATGDTFQLGGGGGNEQENQ